MSFIAWKEINWPLVNFRIFRYQTRIFKASRENNIPKMRCLQKRLLKSFDAKLVAVRQVTIFSKGKKTGGVAEQVSVTDLQKGKLVQRLRLDGKILPIRTISIDKPGKLEKRSFYIRKVENQAKQVLCQLALEPEWEARFEANSYGFRPGRSYHDATKAIFLSLRNKSGYQGYHKYILDVDITKCFSQMESAYLLKKLGTLPEIEKQISAWVKDGLLEKFLEIKKKTKISEKMVSTLPEEILSPLLVNIALHGLENYMKEWICNRVSFAKTNKNSKEVKHKSLVIIRYAYNLILIHNEETIIHEAKEKIATWLWNGPRFKLAEEKMTIQNTKNGFNFLGFSFIILTHGNTQKIKIYPSRKSQEVLLLKVRTILQNNRRESSYILINLLRPIIIGWANYFKYSECSYDFQKLTHLIFQKLRAWVFCRDTRNGRKIVKKRYFPSGKSYTFEGVKHYDNWVLNGYFSCKNGILKNNWLPHLVWVKRGKWIKIKGTKSPFDGDILYWEKRAKNKGTCTLKSHKQIK